MASEIRELRERITRLERQLYPPLEVTEVLGKDKRGVLILGKTVTRRV